MRIVSSSLFASSSVLLFSSPLSSSILIPSWNLASDSSSPGFSVLGSSCSSSHVLWSSPEEEQSRTTPRWEVKVVGACGQPSGLLAWHPVQHSDPSRYRQRTRAALLVWCPKVAVSLSTAIIPKDVDVSLSQGSPDLLRKCSQSQQPGRPGGEPTTVLGLVCLTRKS